MFPNQNCFLPIDCASIWVVLLRPKKIVIRFCENWRFLSKWRTNCTKLHEIARHPKTPSKVILRYVHGSPQPWPPCPHWLVDLAADALRRWISFGWVRFLLGDFFNFYFSQPGAGAGARLNKYCYIVI